jgi:hypothetical protein
MGEQYRVEALESNTGFKNLTLRALSAINQKAIFLVLDHHGG